MAESFMLELSDRQVKYLLELVQLDRIRIRKGLHDPRYPTMMVDNLGDKLMALTKGKRE